MAQPRPAVDAAPPDEHGDAAVPPPPHKAALPRRLWRRLDPLDRAALNLWLLTRLGVLTLSWAVYGMTHNGGTGGTTGAGGSGATSWLGLWQHWDWERYLTIAGYGYTSGKGPAFDDNLVAFFPGYPLALRAVHLVVRNWTVSGLLLSFVAGGVACVALARLARIEWLERAGAETRGAEADGGEDAARAGRAGRTAVLLLLCAPAAVFLAVGYTESLFLAFALTGWLAARRRRWVAAGVLVGLATLVRVNGLFVAVALAVLFLCSRPRRKDWLRAPALALPAVSAACYGLYLRAVTGDWMAWKHAEERGWGRTLTNPLTALRNTWQIATGRRSPTTAFGGGGGGRGGGFGHGGGPGGTGVPQGTGGGGARQGTGGGGAAQGGGAPQGGGVSQGGGRGGTFDGVPGAPGGAANGSGHAASQVPGQGTGGPGFSASRGGGGGMFGTWPFQLELVAVAIGVLLVLWLLWRRRWPESVLVGLSVTALATSPTFVSVPRDMLLWWPLWTALAVWMVRRPWLRTAYLALSVPTAVCVAYLFLTGGWAG